MDDEATQARLQVGFYQDRQPTLKRNALSITKTISKGNRKKKSSEKKILSKYIKSLGCKKPNRPKEPVTSPWEDGSVSNTWKHSIIKGKEEELTKNIVTQKLDQEVVEGTSQSEASLAHEKKKRRKRSSSLQPKASRTSLPKPKLSAVSVRKGSGRFRLSKSQIKKERRRKFCRLRKKYEKELDKQLSQSIDELYKKPSEFLVEDTLSSHHNKNEKLETSLRRKVCHFLENNNVATTTGNPKLKCNNDNEQLIRCQYNRLLSKLLPKPILK
jgi:hypothetical protein